MTVMKIVDPRLQWFADRMREALALPENQAKEDWRGQKCHPGFLLSEIERHEIELGAALHTFNNEEILRRAVNIANFAMMLADRYCNPKPDEAVTRG